jgi:hypothetical protein
VDDSIIFTIHDHTLYNDTSTLEGGWGGIRLYANASDTAYFRYCRFSFGKAVEPGTDILYTNENLKGGAIFINGYAHVQISQSFFLRNRANYEGGGIAVYSCNSIMIDKSIFQENFTYWYGGGIMVRSCNQAVIDNSLYIYNTALHVGTMALQGVGSGICLYTNATVSNCRFFNNNSVNGALYESSFNSLIYNNVIANNRGPGGIFSAATASRSRLVNNTIVNNLNYDPGGCGFYFFSKTTVMRNNIVYGNDWDASWHDPIQIYSPDPIMADFAYSCNPDPPENYQGEGNIHDDPLFVNPTPGPGPAYDGLSADWTLQDGSPCVNTGTPDTTGLNLPALDLAGNPRIFGIRVDMGAYENQMVVGLPQNPLVNAQLLASPNPFRNAFAVELFGPEKVKRITVYNQTGTPVRQLETIWHEGLVSIDMSGFAAGLYVLTVEYENGSAKTEKMVKL